MIDRFLHGLAEKMEDPDDCTFMTVVIPGDIDPFERHYRFSIHVDAELRIAQLGCSVGGGTLYYEPNDPRDELEIASSTSMRWMSEPCAACCGCTCLSSERRRVRSCNSANVRIVSTARRGN